MSAKRLTTIRQTGAAVNYATLIGHNTVRRAVMGTENRDPTVAGAGQDESLVWRAMADGAVGFSTGLQYVPGTYARSRRSSNWRGLPATPGACTPRTCATRAPTLEQAVAETIQIGEMAGCRVQISHLKVDSPSRWGASVRALALIDAATRPRGRCSRRTSMPTPRRAPRSASAFRPGRSRAGGSRLRRG